MAIFCPLPLPMMAFLCKIFMNKSFSLMLAWRYLNPRRAWISTITMISVIGVLLGVLVLVVVMAVYAGMEQEQKKRLLGFSPHLLVQKISDGASPTRIDDWAQATEDLKKIPGVIQTYPHVEDNAIVDSQSFQRPIGYQAVDTSDAQQFAAIDAILDRKNYPSSTADLGLDARAVVSSILAEQFGWSIGDKINLYSTRNFDQVFRAYKSTEEPVVRDRFPEEIKAIRAYIEQTWREDENGFTMDSAGMGILNQLEDIYHANRLRTAEAETIQEALDILQEADFDEKARTAHFPQGTKADMSAIIKTLEEADQKQLDSDELMQLKDIVLPREVEVVGIYQASLMVKMPDVFLPLSIAQGLSCLEDSVQGIALKVEDPYRLTKVMPGLLNQLSPQWYVTTWEEQYEGFFNLINQQRVMMYFVLSFIILISSFSMMAVMFTVTIQKKREIGVMKALGATPGQIMRVFVYQGTILGAAGSLLGVLLAFGVLAIRGKLMNGLRVFGFDPFPQNMSGFDILPAIVVPKDLVIIFSMGLFLCIFASFIPAWFAARSDAAKSLRNI